MTLHPDLTADRWFSLTLAGRAIRAREVGNEQRCSRALARARALAQLDLTLADPRWAGHRRREIARAREAVCDLLVGDNVYGSTPASVEAWFMAYAVWARAGTHQSLVTM